MKISKRVLNTIICPCCSWNGTVDELGEDWQECPECRYENGVEPERLLTIGEMVNSEYQEVEYDDVRFDLFLKSLFKLLEIETE